MLAIFQGEAPVIKRVKRRGLPVLSQVLLDHQGTMWLEFIITTPNKRDPVVWRSRQPQPISLVRAFRVMVFVDGLPVITPEVADWAWHAVDTKDFLNRPALERLAELMPRRDEFISLRTKAITACPSESQYLTTHYKLRHADYWVPDLEELKRAASNPLSERTIRKIILLSDSTYRSRHSRGSP